jgi:hypothetical protein
VDIAQYAWMSFSRAWIISSRLAIEILTANVVTVLDEIPASSDTMESEGWHAEEAVLNKLHKNYPAHCLKTVLKFK